MSIIFEYPVWFIIFCLILGVVYAWVLYFYSASSEYSIRLRRILFFIRTFAVTLIAMLLLSPLLKIVNRNTQKPIILIVQDNSISIKTNKDSLFYINEYPALLKNFKNKLSDKFSIKNFIFGEKLQDNELNTNNLYSEKETDISTVFEQIKNNYGNRNVGALIVATDGIYTKGSNPLYSSQSLNFPVYTVALGDTSIQKDIKINSVNYNKTAFLGNSFMFDINIMANKSAGTKTKLKIKQLNNTAKSNVFERDIDINSNSFNRNFIIHLDADKIGIAHYRIELEAIKDEITKANNIEEIFIEVLNEKEKILILCSSPHPDISAIKESIETNSNYSCESFVINDFTKNINEYNVIILHQLPSVKTPASLLLSNITKIEIPVLFIIGTSSDIASFNRLQNSLSITESQLSFNEALPVLNNEFPLFTLSRELADNVSFLPPLMSPFGNYNLKTSSNVLYYQKIGNVPTKKPLFIFNQSGNIRNAVIVGEGIWKWRMHNYMQKNNHDMFNELISKTIQYLSVRRDKNPLRIITKGKFNENEPVTFDAELYNQSFELVNEPEVNLVLTDKSNKKYPFVFTRTDKAYHLDAGIFPPGIYKYSANAKLGNVIHKKEGEITISQIYSEKINTIADHQILYNISKSHNANMFYPAQLNQLADEINKREDIKSISYTQKRYNEIINIKWVLGLILLLLSFEWFIRKRQGGY